MSLCFTDPGYEVDLTLEAPLSTLYQVWLGTLTLPAAADGRVSITGPRELVRADPARRAAAEPGGSLRPPRRARGTAEARVTAARDGPAAGDGPARPLGPVVWHTSLA